MPIKGARYRMKKTPKGMMRLAFKGNKVMEAKNMKTGKMHTKEEMMMDKKKKAKSKAKKTMKSLRKRK